MDAHEMKWGAIGVIGIVFGFALMAWAVQPMRVEMQKTKQLELQLEIERVKASGNQSK